MTHDEMITVIEHHKKGGTVEARVRCRPGKWQVVPSPLWMFNHYEYRPKKEPVAAWVVTWGDGNISPYVFMERENAERYADVACGGRVIKMVEAGA